MENAKLRKCLNEYDLSPCQVFMVVPRFLLVDQVFRRTPPAHPSQGGSSEFAVRVKVLLLPFDLRGQDYKEQLLFLRVDLTGKSYRNRSSIDCKMIIIWLLALHACALRYSIISAQTSSVTQVAH